MSTFTVMEIDEFEAGMLDAVLEAFGDADQLGKQQILELFADDEPLATAVVDLLIATGMATPAGQITTDGLPELISRSAQAPGFLENGGFTAQVHSDKVNAAKKPEESIDNPEPFEIEADQFDDPAVEAAQPEPEITGNELSEVEAPADELPEPPPAPKIKREVIFEIEIAKGDDAYNDFEATSEDVFEPEAEEDQTEEPVEEETELPQQVESALPETEQPEYYDTELNTLPAELLEPEETLPEPQADLHNEDSFEEEVHRPIVEDTEPVYADMPVETTIEPTPATSALEPEEAAIVEEEKVEAPTQHASAQLTAISNELEVLRAEVFKMQRDKILTENQLREKDSEIQTLNLRNKQLAQLRTFIWLLLAVIVFFVVWIVTH